MLITKQKVPLDFDVNININNHIDIQNWQCWMLGSSIRQQANLELTHSSSEKTNIQSLWSSFNA